MPAKDLFEKRLVSCVVTLLIFIITNSRVLEPCGMTKKFMALTGI